MSTFAQRTAAFAKFTARRAFVAQAMAKHGLTDINFDIESAAASAFFDELAAYDAQANEAAPLIDIDNALPAFANEGCSRGTEDDDGSCECADCVPDRIGAMTVDQLRDSGHCVIVWTPDEVGNADTDDLASLCIERGHIYLEDFATFDDSESAGA